MKAQFSLVSENQNELEVFSPLRTSLRDSGKQKVIEEDEEEEV